MSDTAILARSRSRPVAHLFFVLANGLAAGTLTYGLASQLPPLAEIAFSDVGLPLGIFNGLLAVPLWGRMGEAWAQRLGAYGLVFLGACVAYALFFTTRMYPPNGFMFFLLCVMYGVFYGIPIALPMVALNEILRWVLWRRAAPNAPR